MEMMCTEAMIVISDFEDCQNYHNNEIYILLPQLLKVNQLKIVCKHGLQFCNLFQLCDEKPRGGRTRRRRRRRRRGRRRSPPHTVQRTMVLPSTEVTTIREKARVHARSATLHSTSLWEEEEEEDEEDREEKEEEEEGQAPHVWSK